MKGAMHIGYQSGLIFASFLQKPESGKIGRACFYC